MPFIKGTDSEGHTLWLDQRGYWQLGAVCAERFSSQEAQLRVNDIKHRNRLAEESERVEPIIVENLRG